VGELGEMTVPQALDVVKLDTWIQRLKAVIVFSVGVEEANVWLKDLNLFSQQKIELGYRFQNLSLWRAFVLVESIEVGPRTGIPLDAKNAFDFARDVPKRGVSAGLPHIELAISLKLGVNVVVFAVPPHSLLADDQELDWLLEIRRRIQEQRPVQLQFFLRERVHELRESFDVGLVEVTQDLHRFSFHSHGPGLVVRVNLKDIFHKHKKRVNRRRLTR
jgi:hypothetical protein